jgi:hypothetical protein
LGASAAGVAWAYASAGAKMTAAGTSAMSAAASSAGRRLKNFIVISW